MTKYSEMKKAYDILVKVKSSGLYTTKELHQARADFRAAAQELFPSTGSRAEFAALDMIQYYAIRYSKSK